MGTLRKVDENEAMIASGVSQRIFNQKQEYDALRAIVHQKEEGLLLLQDELRDIMLSQNSLKKVEKLKKRLGLAEKQQRLEQVLWKLREAVTFKRVFETMLKRTVQAAVRSQKAKTAKQKELDVLREEELGVIEKKVKAKSEERAARIQMRNERRNINARFKKLNKAIAPLRKHGEAASKAERERKRREEEARSQRIKSMEGQLRQQAKASAINALSRNYHASDAMQRILLIEGGSGNRMQDKNKEKLVSLTRQRRGSVSSEVRTAANLDALYKRLVSSQEKAKELEGTRRATEKVKDAAAEKLRELQEELKETIRSVTDFNYRRQEVDEVGNRLQEKEEEMKHMMKEDQRMRRRVWPLVEGLSGLNRKITLMNNLEQPGGGEEEGVEHSKKDVLGELETFQGGTLRMMDAVQRESPDGVPAFKLDNLDSMTSIVVGEIEEGNLLGYLPGIGGYRGLSRHSQRNEGFDSEGEGEAATVYARRPVSRKQPRIS